ncbi:MAG: flagellar motor switch protein FliG [Treponema sp.]|jgi:flagellar motor switch protein FliG|nr:flagellar motor switch protein FliG [Treponema sp.]
MGNSKVPKSRPHIPGGAASGAAAYQRVLQGVIEDPEDRRQAEKAPPRPVPRKGAPSAAPEEPPAPAPREGLLKTGKDQAPPPAAPATAGGDSKIRRTAKFLILIGGEKAAQILAHLDTEQVEAISREIASIRGITAEEGERVLEEFRSLLSMSYGYSGYAAGGLETCRKLLYAAFGPEKGESLLNKTVPASREDLFAFLEDFSPEQLALLLKDESPAAAALILSRLSSKTSAAVLANTPGERKLDIVRRIARQGQVSPEVLERVAAAVKEKARHIGRSDTETVEVDGMNALTAILKHADYAFGDQILQDLEHADPGLGRDLKERLYTLDDVIKADDRPLREKLAAMPDRDIALLLKGRAPEFTEKILANVSARRRAQIREEGEILGAVSRRDCDTAAGDFLAWFRQSREEGRILLVSDEDVII